jgi:hypothetical protein
MARSLRDALGLRVKRDAAYKEGRRLAGGIAGPRSGWRISQPPPATRPRPPHPRRADRGAWAPGSFLPGESAPCMPVWATSTTPSEWLDIAIRRSVGPDPVAGPSAARSDSQGPAVLADGGTDGTGRLGSGKARLLNSISPGRPDICAAPPQSSRAAARRRRHLGPRDRRTDTFSPFDVVGHLIDGEETDWMPRALLIRARDGAPFTPTTASATANATSIARSTPCWMSSPASAPPTSSC